MCCCRLRAGGRLDWHERWTFARAGCAKQADVACGESEVSAHALERLAIVGGDPHGGLQVVTLDLRAQPPHHEGVDGVGHAADAPHAATAARAGRDHAPGQRLRQSDQQEASSPEACAANDGGSPESGARGFKALWAPGSSSRERRPSPSCWYCRSLPRTGRDHVRPQPALWLRRAKAASANVIDYDRGSCRRPFPSPSNEPGNPRPCGRGRAEVRRVFTDHMFLADWEGGDGVPAAAGRTRAWSPSGRSACHRPPPGCTTARACSTG